MSVHNVNENMNTCSAMHVRSMLLKIILLTVQEMHLDEVHFLRNKISQFESITLKSINIETSTYRNQNVVKKQLNSVVETVDCKQLISHVIVEVLTKLITLNQVLKFNLSTQLEKC